MLIKNVRIPNVEFGTYRYNYFYYLAIMTKIFTRITICFALLTIVSGCASKELKRHVWVKINMEYADGTQIDYYGNDREVMWQFTDQSVEEWIDGRINWRLPYKLTSNGKVIKLNNAIDTEIIQLDESCLRIRQFDESKNQYFFTNFQSDEVYDQTIQFMKAFERSKP